MNTLVCTSGYVIPHIRHYLSISQVSRTSAATCHRIGQPRPGVVRT